MSDRERQPDLESKLAEFVRAWIEPFFGIVRISASGDSIIRYELHFGDAARRLGSFPYLKHIRWESWFFPKDWLFSFSKGLDQAARLQ